MQSGESSPPITAETVALAAESFSNLRSFQNELYVACGDPKNSGKFRVRTLSWKDPTPKTLTPLSSNVRSRVHEYGGGSFCIDSSSGGDVIFTDIPSNGLYRARRESTGDEVAMELLMQKDSCRFADFCFVNDTTPYVVAIMEDHTNPQPASVQNSLVAITIEKDCTITTVASGHDFYACPQVNEDRTKLVYVAWDHPNMPWNSTHLYMQGLGPGGKPDGPPKRIDAAGSSCSLQEPRWLDENTVVFLSDTSGWYNLYRWNEQQVKSVNLYPMDTDFTEPAQGWILGLSPYVILPDKTIVLKYSCAAGTKLVHLTKDGQAEEFEVPSSSVSSLCATEEGFYYVGGSPVEPPALWHCALCDKSCQKLLTSMDPSVLEPFQSRLSSPRRIRFPSPGVIGFAYGFYYPPSRSVSSDTTIKPPLLVKTHGGPTSRTSTTFRMDIQFWTSKGFAVLDVDYGGSTGYGRAYRQSLDGNWGIVDVNDACNGAKYCVEQGWVNERWLSIDGRSAGGYTTLASLTFQNVFTAGASLYGISNLVALCKETHKFESRYMDSLVGPYPEKEDLYNERAPIMHTENLSCPVILLQGTEDKVVPPGQAEEMYDVLRSKGIETTLVLYNGEGHGFRRGENISHSLNSQYSFFCQMFGLETNDVDKIPIGEKLTI